MGQINVNLSSIVSITKVDHFYFAIDNNILRSNCLSFVSIFQNTPVGSDGYK